MRTVALYAFLLNVLARSVDVDVERDGPRDVVVGSSRQYACSHGNHNEPIPLVDTSRHIRG